MASFAASVDATYLAPVEDCETLACSFNLQEMGPPVSRKMAPETEQHMLGSMA